MHLFADVKTLNPSLMNNTADGFRHPPEIVAQQRDNLNMDLTNQGFSHADEGCYLGQSYMLVTVHR
jgi:hypothetical protein